MAKRDTSMAPDANFKPVAWFLILASLKSRIRSTFVRRL